MLAFISLIHFEFIFVYGVRKSSNFILLRQLYVKTGQLCPFFPAALIEETVFSPVYILASFVKDKVPTGAWVYLWAFCLVPLVYISVFVPVPYCLDDCLVQLLSHVQLFAISWTAACPACLSIISSQNLLRLMLIESVMLSSHLILCRPLLLLPSVFPSLRVFSSELALSIRWPKYWRFSFNISPFSEYSGLVSFRIDWFDLLGVQGTLKSLLQHHSSKASILQCSAFFTIQLSQSYMTTRKTIVLTRWTFVGKVMSLLFNMLFRLVIALLPRCKHLFISWLQSPSVVILEPQKIKWEDYSNCFWEEVEIPGIWPTPHSLVF